MNDKIQVLDAIIHNDSAKAAMTKMVDYIRQDTFHVVEVVTMQSLVKLLEQEEHRQYLEAFDFTFAGDKEVLEAGGVTDDKRLKEAEDMLFVKMFLRYLHKNRKKVFVLADDEETLQKVFYIMTENYRDIRVVEHAVLSEQGPSEEMIINQINGVETDCVMAFMASPLQEEFLIRNRSLINTKVWIGLGREFCERMSESSWFFRVKKLLTLRFWKKKIEKEQKKM